MKKMNIFISTLFSLLIACQQPQGNRVIVTGGSVRLVTYSKINSEAIEIRDFKTGDKVLGIGILLDVEPFDDGQNFDLTNKSTFGPMDTILSINAYFCRSGDTTQISEFLWNDSTMNNLVFPHGFIRPYRTMPYDTDRKYYKAKVYKNLDAYKSQYNDRTMFTKTGVFEAENMEQEFFFWISDTSIIRKSQRDGVIQIELVFNNRLLILNGERM